jgi:hypothetical protein
MASLAAAGLLVVSCFEKPVSERIGFSFQPDGTVEISVAVELSALDKFKGNPAAQNRIEGLRRDLLEGVDDWSRRFKRIRPSWERVTVEKREGVVQVVLHTAIVADPVVLERFFDDTPLAVTFLPREGWSELAFYHRGGDRASPSQRRRVRRELDVWSSRVADYLQATWDLYEYLEARPERARACFGRLLGDLLSEKVRRELQREGGPDRLERALIDPLEEAMSAMMIVLQVPESEAYSINELSQLVYDPFPARLTVDVPGPVIEAEGFDVEQEGRLATPRLSLLGAFGTLRGHWLEPDPFLTYLDHIEGEDDGPLDIEAFAARRRMAIRASSREVRETLEERLTSPSVLRVRWERTAP